MKNISVFGGSQPKPGEEAYQFAYELGFLLGKAGYDIITGGYIGVMEAVSKGASDSGAHVIGVTCDEIEAWRPVLPNRWITEELRFPTLHQRLEKLITLADAAIALPGGIGTLAEISVMWTQLDTGAISPRPLILVGDGWHKVINSFLSKMNIYCSKQQRNWLQFIPDVKSAVSFLQSFS